MNYQKTLEKCGLQDTLAASLYHSRIKDKVLIYSFGATKASLDDKLKRTEIQTSLQMDGYPRVYITGCLDIQAVLSHITEHNHFSQSLVVLVANENDPSSPVTIPEGIRYVTTNTTDLFDDVNDLLERWAFDVTHQMANVMDWFQNLPPEHEQMEFCLDKYELKTSSSTNSRF